MIKPFTHTCIRIADFCEHNGLDLNEVFCKIADADVASFGDNYDTLITTSQLERVLEDILDEDGLKALDYGVKDILNTRISLGS